ncbi:MAG: cysteine desulfurase [Methylococcaceae bacterium]|nr:cysteine desulfurase [Methylococcaceae bacterium]
MIYLDHNASSPLDERVEEAIRPYQNKFFGNPSSLHRHGRLCRDAINRARAQVAQLVGAQPSQIVFTSGGTEANNLAIQGWAAAHPSGIVVAGATEHPSVIEPLEVLARRGKPIARIAVDASGMIHPANLRTMVNDRKALVSIMLANNETGVIQDCKALAQALEGTEAVLHTDAVQAVGKIPVNFEQLGGGLMTLSGHKIGAPQGIGALVIGPGIRLEPLLYGGGQESGLRAGTENVAAIVGFGKAAELARIELAERRERLLRLRDRLEHRLNRLAGTTIFAQNAPRLCNTVQFGVSGIDGETLVMFLDRAGIALSSGSACASGGGEPSPVLTAMGIPAELAKSAVRVSLGPGNTEKDIDRLIEVLTQLHPRHAQVA